ncbi:FAD-dependent oxidoreductase [Nocardioides sp. NPDC000445]|uniref:FAD-dependent oxidoreductase n=1 Tax=Nocardioides sp. NPDC000445 TaxID=3154257 RepID=UPI00331B20A0
MGVGSRTTGSSSPRAAAPIELPGQADIDGAFGLRTVQDADRIREGLGRATHVIVIGTGSIGSEVASAAGKRGMGTTILDSELLPMKQSVGLAVVSELLELHRHAGTAVRLGVTVSGFEGHDGQVSAVLLEDATRVEADLVVVGIGARPATSWLENTGIRLHDHDRGLVCGADLQTSVPGIWAAGDVVHAPDAALNSTLARTEHWTSAAESGAQAGRNATSDGAGEPFRSLPNLWSDWYVHRIQFVGSHRADAVSVAGEPGPGVFVLYRRGRQVVGALSIDRGGDIMKLCRRILYGGDWDEAMDSHARVTSSAHLHRCERAVEAAGYSA